MMIFGKPGSVETFLAEIVRWIAKYVPEYSERCMTPAIWNLVLAGHSGAGAILSNQMMNIQKTVAEVFPYRVSLPIPSSRRIRLRASLQGKGQSMIACITAVSKSL